MATLTFNVSQGLASVKYYFPATQTYFSPSTGSSFEWDSTKELLLYVVPADSGNEFVLKENNSTYIISSKYVTKSCNGNTASGFGTAADGTYAGWDSTFKVDGYRGAYKYLVPQDSVSKMVGSTYLFLNPSGFAVQEKTPTATVNVTYSLTHCTVSPQPTEVDKGVETTFTFTPDSGYRFDTQPEAYYQDSSNGVWRHKSAVNGVLTISSDAEIEITAEAVAIPQPSTYTVTYNLTACSVSPQPNAVTEGESYTLTFTPNAGYRFESQPYATIGDVRTTAVDGTLTFTPTGNVTITATAEVIPPTSYSVSNNLTHATVTPLLSSVTEGQSYTLTFSPDSGYQFDDAPYIIMGGERTTATNNRLTFSPTADVSVYATAVETPKATYPVTYNILNGSVTPSPATVTDGESYTFTFTADDGFAFEEQPTAQWQDGAGRFHTLTAENNILTASFTDAKSGIEISGTAIKQAAITEGYGIIRVYKVTPDNMKALAKFDKDNTGTPDLTQFIASLRKMYAPVESQATVTLRLGGYDTAIQVGQIADDIVSIDCGSIQLTGFHANALDYNQTEVEFWLPFVGVVTVNADRVMDSTVSLTYNVNVLNGECVAILSVDSVPVAHASGNIGYEVPYNINDNYNISDNLTVDPYYLLDLTPSAVIRESMMIASERTTDSAWVRLGDCKGFVSLDDCSITGVEATITELNMIANYVESGVIV